MQGCRVTGLQGIEQATKPAAFGRTVVWALACAALLTLACSGGNKRKATATTRASGSPFAGPSSPAVRAPGSPPPLPVVTGPPAPVVRGPVLTPPPIPAIGGATPPSGLQAAPLPFPAVGETTPAPVRGPSSTPAPNVDNGPLTIGLLVPLSGADAAAGKDLSQGFQLYLSQHNGRLGGFAITLAGEDTASNPATAQAKLRTLAEQDKAAAIVGVASDTVAAAVRGYVDMHQLPTVIAGAGLDDLTQRDKSNWLFRVAATNSQTTQPLGAYACTQLGFKRVALIAQDDSVGTEAAGGFAHSFTDCGGTISQEDYVPAGTGDWAPAVHMLNQSGVDAVFAAVEGDDAPRFLKAYRDAGVALPLLGLGALVDEPLLAQEGATSAGVVSAAAFSAALADPATQAFVKAYADSYGGAPAGIAAADGYLAAEVLDVALLTAGTQATVNPAALRDALRGVKLASTASGGAFAFDDDQQGVFDIYVRQTQQLPDGRPGNLVRTADTLPAVSQFWTYPPDAFLAGKRYQALKGTWAR